MIAVTRILLVDDHDVFREGLKALFEGCSGVVVCGEARDGDDAVRCTEELVPDVVLMDLSLSKRSGIEATEAIVAKQLQSKVLILSRHFDEGIVRQALCAGAAGYVLKQRPFAAVLAAIRAVVSGEQVLDACFQRKGHSSRAAASGVRLTERQEQILKMIARGYRTEEIARELKIAVKTVEAHRATTFKKLGVSNRREFLQYAWLRGWLSGE